MRCGKRRSCSGRVHRLSRQPDPDAAAIVSYAAMDIQQPTSFAQVFPAFWREVELPVYLENDANLACEGEAFLRRARAERPICFICPSARAAAARCAWTENCAAARAAARAR
ncbi:MAG: hypothetical protein ACLRZH_00795 [Ruthenibacterium lactatiformans]